MSEQAKHNVMLVEDDVINLEMLMELLSEEYDVSVATDGISALEIVFEVQPDIILLDVMMPDMDGYQVCKHLKANPRTRNIPVIFLTSMSDVQDEAKGLELGAVDYLTKPFNSELIRMRMRNHLSLIRARQQLEQHNQRLEVVVSQRTEELAKAHEQLKILDATRRNYLNLIAHDLRTPINGLLGIMQIAVDEVADENDPGTILIH